MLSGNGRRYSFNQNIAKSLNNRQEVGIYLGNVDLIYYGVNSIPPLLLNVIIGVIVVVPKLNPLSNFLLFPIVPSKRNRHRRDSNLQPHPRSKNDALDRSATVGRLHLRLNFFLHFKLQVTCNSYSILNSFLANPKLSLY